MINRIGVSLSGLKPGDWARFWNNENYRSVQGQNAMFGSESVIVLSDGTSYYG